MTPSSAFKGTDGPNWDDITFNLKKSGLSGYSGHATITHEGAPLKALSYDCLLGLCTNVKQVRDLKMERAPMTPGITKRLDTPIDLPDQLEGIEPDWKKGIPIEVHSYLNPSNFLHSPYLDHN